MNPERWQQVEQLYKSALKLEPDERRAFLARACPDDEDLLKEVESLLAQEASTLSANGSLSGEATRTQLGPGVVLEHYRIESVLGQGGMGIVFRAFDRRFGK